MSRATASDLERVATELTADTARVLGTGESDASDETLSATAAELGDVGSRDQSSIASSWTVTSR